MTEMTAKFILFKVLYNRHSETERVASLKLLRIYQKG